jgi:HD superfamily phosphohydrolase
LRLIREYAPRSECLLGCAIVLLGAEMSRDTALKRKSSPVGSTPVASRTTPREPKGGPRAARRPPNGAGGASQRFERILVLRDPVHRDIWAGPVQAAIIDTPVFQRLRYIRQTGLLHFVFPGAVHTRFSHSLGTMHLARRVFANLFDEYRQPVANPGGIDPVQYVGTVFETAALLHDLGHCAFSHSIESVTVQGRPFFPSMPEIVEAWGDPTLTSWWQARLRAKDLTIPAKTEHEQVGLLMIGVLFGTRYPQVNDAVRTVLHVEPEEFADDVRAMIIGEMPMSARFRESAAQITKRFVGNGLKIDAPARAECLMSALHTLISGTLDVDRMDYLLRDSLHTGTPYGVYDLDVLVHSLALHAADDALGPSIVLALRSRAVSAFDDMLWGRYQLFAQVLNHKTNVMLNALLAEAIPQALQDSLSTNLGPPRKFDEFVLYTDDLVMSGVTRACLLGTSANRAYDHALVRRVVPSYLGHLPLLGDDARDGVAVQQERARLALELGIGEQEIREWKARSDLVKGGGLPYVLRKNRAAGRVELIAPGEQGAYQIVEWTRSGRLPAKVEQMHFFVGRDVALKQTKRKATA